MTAIKRLVKTICTVSGKELMIACAFILALAASVGMGLEVRSLVFADNHEPDVGAPFPTEPTSQPGPTPPTPAPVPTPQPQPAPVPANMPTSGPADMLAVFAGVSAAGFLAAELYRQRKRSTRQSR